MRAVAGALLVLGARNLGGAIAEHFAAAGWSVAAGARTDETVERFRERVPGGLGIRLDASEPVQVEDAAARTRERFGSLDLMVNAVSPGMRSQGRFGGGPLLEASLEDFEHYGTGVARQAFAFLGSGARALTHGGGGTLVQITGGSARRAMPGKGPWTAGAFATRALTNAAALELREQGVHVALLVVDATIESPRTAAYARDAGPDELTTQEEVARAVEYLWSQPPRAWSHELQITPRGDRWVP